MEVLVARDFGPCWISCVQTILSSTKNQILINGFLHRYIISKCGLRQGDSLSPLHFALVANFLSALFTNMLYSKVLLGVPLGQLEKNMRMT